MRDKKKFRARLWFIVGNLALGIVVLFLVGWLVMRHLSNYTQHGGNLSVPDFTTGMSFREARQLAAEKELRVQIIDSVYNRNAVPGHIVAQLPQAGSSVKRNRMIYLTMNTGIREAVVFPNLQNGAFRQVVKSLENLGLIVGRISYVPSDFRNLVVNVSYNGRILQEGQKILKGEKVDLILGSGNADEVVFLPLLVGESAEDARRTLFNGYLNTIFVSDSTITSAADQREAVVWDQSPAFNAKGSVLQGSDVTLYITRDSARISTVDSLKRVYQEIR